MSRAGEVYENPVTGERAVVRVGTEESGGEMSISDLYISPGGAAERSGGSLTILELAPARAGQRTPRGGTIPRRSGCSRNWTQQRKESRDRDHKSRTHPGRDEALWGNLTRPGATRADVRCPRIRR